MVLISSPANYKWEHLLISLPVAAQQDTIFHSPLLPHTHTHTHTHTHPLQTGEVICQVNRIRDMNRHMCHIQAEETEKTVHIFYPFFVFLPAGNRFQDWRERESHMMQGTWVSESLEREQLSSNQKHPHWLLHEGEINFYCIKLLKC